VHRTHSELRLQTEFHDHTHIIFDALNFMHVDLRVWEGVVVGRVLQIDGFEWGIMQRMYAHMSVCQLD
jgi:hypothetical protein